MVKQFLLIIGFLFSIQVMAQTGIGTTTPNASAKLDVFSDNKGFLPPRVTLTSATDNTTIPNPAEGLLVYNKGSVGLQAGYYYWNNANWATIATATSSGNGVTSMDMVQLYSKAYSAAIADSTIANATGYKFTVPVSGRYLFDFSCTAFTSQTKFTMSFKVRQGTTDLSTDAQTSANNSVRVEYNGKLEVNLQAGTTYNVYVTGGSRNSDDYDRVYYKLVAGNLPVTGQSVDYVSVSNIYQTGIGDNRDLIFTSNNGGNIPYNTSTGIFTLSANKTYLFQAQVRANTPSANSSYIEYGFVDATTNSLLINGTETITSSTTATGGYGSNPVINFIYTPSTNQTVKLRTTVNSNGTQTIVSGTANITQIGSSAIVNPWVLSGTNTYNTTGNVGIGTNTPTSRLNIAGGGIKIASSLGNTSTRPNLNTSSIGNYEIRGVGGGSPQIDAQDDGFLRLSAGGGTSVNTQSSIDLSGYSTVSDMSSNIVMRTGGTERLRVDNSGNVNITGKLNIGDPTGNVSTKLVGRVTAGNFLTFENLRFSVTNSGGLILATTAGSVNFYVEGRFNNGTNGGYILGARTAGTVNYTTTPSGSLFGWGFGSSGDTIIYHFIDPDNSRMYRVTIIIMPSYINNFISIERLL